ncbi:hypothetical protein [uncultured Maritimibacter sp.]|uniref:hypothetical protein n=1 Tax=uncultured Maritimibacter sp. TaxID=991866 RepID=UPI002593090D|nr:hypothetical protein [uncultured Maritimibacter sp.]
MIYPADLRVVKPCGPLLPGDAHTMEINYRQLAADLEHQIESEKRSKERGASRRAAALREKASRLIECADDLRQARLAHLKAD